MKKTSHLFVIKCLLLALPFFVLIAVYVVNDPYMVIYKYNKYDNSYLFPDESYVGWRTYMKNRDKQHFNTFIMGNSCTMAFKCSSIERILGNGTHAIRLFGNNERLSSVYLKLKALEKYHAKLDHVLIISDASMLMNTALAPSAQYILPPEMTGDGNLYFQSVFFQSFMDPNTVIKYLDFSLFHHYRKSMQGLINPYGQVRNPVNCEAENPHDKEIASEGDSYWKINKDFFYKQTPRMGDKIIGPSQMVLLRQIKAICMRNHCDLEFIIGPEYDQTKLNPSDIASLESVFGTSHVFDYSGVNSFTNDVRNYYDKAHFRTTVGDSILRAVYGQSCRCHSEGIVAHKQ